MTSSSTAGRKETERTKLIQEKCQTLLTQMLRDEDNKYCVDCDAKGPRWASWNLGVFLCIRCAGIHRNLGVHISRVKSVNLDTWTPEQVISLQQMGNSRARAVYEAQLPDGFRRPQTDSALETFIRAKYEHKKYIAREWVPPSPPKVDWAKEIDEELERQKRKKKAAQANASLGVGVLSNNISSSSSSANTSSVNDKKLSSSSANSTTNSAKNISLPAPMSKAKPNNHNHSPKTQRISTGSNDGSNPQTTNDLLGLSSPIKTSSSGALSTTLIQTSGNSSMNGVNGAASNGIVDFGQNDSFNSFLSSSSTSALNQQNQALHMDSNQQQHQQQNSLAKEEEDFFNQGSLSGAGGNAGEKDASGKLSKDSILALYGNGPKNPPPMMQSNSLHMGFGQNPSSTGNAASANMFGAVNNSGFAGMPPGFMATGNAGMSNQQFMTPPNSTSLYNSPVMTAPAAFSASGMNSMQMSGTGGFATQFPMQGVSTNFSGLSGNGVGPSNLLSMQTTTGTHSPMSLPQAANNLNIMQTHQNLINGLQMNSMGHSNQNHMNSAAPVGMNPGMSGGRQVSMPPMGGLNNFATGTTMPMMPSFPTMSGMNGSFPATNNTNVANSNPAMNMNLNQQFGNLNLGDVWQ